MQRIANDEAEKLLDEIRSRYRQQPDFEYWAKHDTWESAEAAALLLGLKPGSLNKKPPQRPEPGEHYPPEWGVQREPWAMAFYELYALLSRSQTGRGQGTPAEYLAWAERKGYEIPAELAAAVGHLGVGTVLGDKAENTLLSIIGLLATAYADGKTKYKNSGRTNAAVVVRDLLPAVDTLNNDSGLSQSTLEKKISAGLAALEERRR